MNDRPKLYIVQSLWDQIAMALENGEEPDPLAVNTLCSIGPDLIDSYFLYIQTKEAEGKAKREMAREFTEAARRTETTVENLKEYAAQVVRNIGGDERKVKTSLGTYWVQKTQSWEFEVTPEAHPEFFKVEYSQKKKEMTDLMKAGNLPPDIPVTLVETESVRVKR